MTLRSKDDILSPRGEVNSSYELPHTRIRNSIPVFGTIASVLIVEPLLQPLILSATF